MTDIYYKKELKYKFEDKILRFEVGNTLFSTFDIDHGTDILVRHIKLEQNPKTILDIGCGVGVIGICLASKYPDAKVTCVDRDLLAVRYTKNNTEKNNLSNLTTIGSVGMEEVKDEKFDLIVSNVPAKIGDEAITQEFILKPLDQLNEGGSLWIVVVSALNRLIPKVARDFNLSAIEVKKRSGHSVYRITKK